MSKKIVDLTNDEIKEIVGLIFAPKKISNIKRVKRSDELSMTIYTEWETMGDDGNTVEVICDDELTLKNPYTHYGCGIHVYIATSDKDEKMWLEYCFAKGILPKWIEQNRFIKKERVDEQKVYRRLSNTDAS